MKKTIFSILAIICIFSAASCQKGDGDAEYGIAKVYITQAMTNGTIDNVYAVPGGDDIYTYNFKAEDDVVKVYLSVYRSGKLKADAVTVNVQTDVSASEKEASKTGAEVMPEGMYSLPATVTVPADKNSTTFYLELQKSALSAAEAAGKVYVLCVNITNPSRYELYESASQVVVKLDVDALKSLVL